MLYNPFTLRGDMNKLITSLLGITLILSSSAAQAAEIYLSPAASFRIPIYNFARVTAKPKDDGPKVTPKPLPKLPEKPKIETIKDHRERLMFQAMNNMELSLYHLNEAEKLSDYIPDLTDRKYFGEIIVGATTAIFVAVTDGLGIPAILALGLPLTSSLAKDSSEKYFAMRDHLVQAQHYGEMASFYRYMAFICPKYGSDLNEKEPDDEGTKNFYTAMGYLNYATLMATCIDDYGIQYGICRQIDEVNSLLLEYSDALHQLKIAREIATLYENMGEIVAECEDQQIRNSINEYVYLAYYHAKQAETYWYQ